MTARDLVIAAPYPEEGAVQLARAAERAERLRSLVMPSRGPSRAAAGVLGLLGRRDAARRLRRGAADVGALQEVDPVFEPMRLAAALPVVGGLVPDIHRLKEGFDRRVADLPVDGRVLVGMPESTRLAFERHTDVLRVFHEVDGHPRARNEVLERFYGARRAAAESHSPAVVDRIESELALADLVLSPSGAVTAQMREHGVPAGKLLQAHLGVDLAAFAAPADADGDHIGRRRPVLLYVGQISLRKGIPFLLDAVRGRPVDLRLLGPVVDGALLQGAPSNAEYLGTTSHAGVAAAMRDADAFVFPTLEDAFGLVLVEAAASGLPVVTTDGAGAAEVLGPLDAVRVPVGDARSLGDAVADVPVLRPDERVERGERIRADAASGALLDWDGWSSRVLEGVDRRLSGE